MTEAIHFGEWQLCPKCHGIGVLSRPPHLPADILEWSSTQTQFVCDVCNGLKIMQRPVMKIDSELINN